jgi:Chalcone isomerase-like
MFCALKKTRKLTFALGLSAVASLSLAQTTSPAAVTSDATLVAGVPFDNEINLNGTKLKLNGAGVRYKAVFKVYAAALYLPSKATTPAGIYGMQGSKRLHAVMLREVDSTGFGKATSQVMSDNLPKERIGKCLPGIMKLSDIFSAKKKMGPGETYSIDEIAGKGVAISINGQRVAEVAEPEFFDCLMHNYFGDKPADEGLKRAMLGGQQFPAGQAQQP